MKFVLLVSVLFAAVFCFEQNPIEPVPISTSATPTLLTIKGGDFTTTIALDTWKLITFETDTSKVILEETSSTTRLSVTVWKGRDYPIYLGYLFRTGKVLEKYEATKVDSWRQVENTVELVVSTTSPNLKISVKLFDFKRRQYSFKATVPGKNSPLKEPRIFMSQGFMTPKKEGFYGLGERFNTNNHRGHVIEAWVEEGGWSTGFFLPRKSKIRVPRYYSTHFPIPFFISNLKYGFEVDTNYTSVFDFAKTKKDEFNVESQSTDVSWTIYGGKSPLETLKMYTERRGRSLIPPKWAFGPWSQAGGEFNFTRDPYRASQEFLKLDSPISHVVNTLHFLPANSERGREAQVKKLSSDLLGIGLKQTAYYNPYVRKDVSPDYDPCEKAGYFLKHHNTTDSYVFWYFGVNFYQCSMFDFTNEEAVKYFKKILQRSVDLGFKGWMQDYAEYAPYYSKAHDGRFGDELHNPYPVLFQKATFEFLQQYDENPNDKYAPDYIPYCRSGYTGTSKWQWATWSGDPSSDWSYAAGLPAQVTALSNLGLSGVPYSSSDIGGFTWWVTPPPENQLWCRWAQFSVFTSFMHTQTGGKGFGKKTKIMDTPEGRFCWRKFSKLRTQLFHYIYNAAHDAYDSGVPLLRHHLLEFPEDEYSHSIAYDFTFGKDMLVSPVVDEDQTKKSIYLPKGENEWFDMMSNMIYDEKEGRFRIKYSEPFKGGQNVTVISPVFSHIPVFIKSGTILPLLDPSVWTLNDASNENVVTYSKREHLLHLMIFQNSKGTAKGNVWDGAEFLFSENSFIAQDKKNRILILQIPIKEMKFTRIIGNTGPIDKVDSYKKLLSVDRNSKSGWAVATDEKVIWIRMQPEVRKIQII